MKTRPILALFALLLLAPSCAFRRAVRPEPCPLCVQLPITLSERLAGAPKTVQGETLQMRATLGKFYRQRGYEISWTDSGCWLPRVDYLIRALERASLEGLNPDNYHLAQIRKSRRTWFTSHGAIPDPQRIIDFDVLCTDAYLLYASHLLAGFTDLDRVKAQWALLRRKADLTQVLERALQNNDIEGSLLALCPPQNGYANLKLALALYRKQNRDADAIHKIKFNMDRWRWLPTDLGDRYILVNIPEFTLRAFENGEEKFSMPIIVGQTEDGKETPVFSDRMTYVQFNPYWNVPRDIAAREILEKVQNDPMFLENNHMEVVKGEGRRTVVIDPATIDWCEFTPNYFPYRFRQKPGTWNALGNMKFMFPNQYNVYIHGTPEKQLFSKRRRTFSHGCVRVQDPVKLMQFVMNDPEWDEKCIRLMLEDRESTVVTLPVPIPVYLLYWTATADDHGRVTFRDDIYKRDEELKGKFYQ